MLPLNAALARQIAGQAAIIKIDVESKISFHRIMVCIGEKAGSGDFEMAVDTSSCTLEYVEGMQKEFETLGFHTETRPDLLKINWEDRTNVVSIKKIGASGSVSGPQPQSS